MVVKEQELRVDFRGFAVRSVGLDVEEPG
jgi:hypothetical protein